MKYLKQIGGHPVQKFLMQLIHYEQVVSYPSYDHEAVYIEDAKGKVIAAISFERQEWQRVIKINGAFVDQHHRRKAHHTRMFKQVCAIAKRDGYVKVDSFVRAENKASQAAMKKQGRKIEGYVMTFDIKGGFTGSITNRNELADG